MAAAKPMAPNRRRPPKRKRRAEVEWRLAEAGLKKGPRRSQRGAAWDDTRSRRLAQVLPELGPVFASFGLYLSSRADLLPPVDCLELAAIPDCSPALGAQEVEQLVQRELGSFVEQTGLEIGRQPLQSRLLFQMHPARLDDGRQATVKVVRPGLQSWIERDARHLSLLQGTLGSNVPLQEAAQDFTALLRRIDLNEEAEALAMQGQSDDFKWLASPKPVAGLCSPRVLVSEGLPGARLDQVLDALPTASPSGRVELPGGHRIPTDELARFLCLAWLRLALLETSFPRWPRADNIWILEDRRIAFTDGAFSALDAPSRENLLQHLIASAKRDPIASCSHLSKELAPPSSGAPGAQPDLELWFRQIAPFRDGGWDLHSSGDSTAEYLFAQWRLARQHGFRPRRQLVPFFQGLFQTASLARRLAPGRDTLKEALDDLRVSFEMARLRKMMTAGNWTENFDRYASLIVELPQKLDEVLNKAVQGKPLVKVELKQDQQQRKRHNSLYAAVALLLLLVAVSLLSRQIPQWTGGAAWAEQVCTLIFALLGGMLLWKASRV